MSARAQSWRRRMSGAAFACAFGLLAATPAAFAAAGASAASEAQPSPEITQAERLIFTTEHLHGVAPRTELDYELVASGEGAKANDVVRVLVASQGNTKGDAQVSDRSGAVTLPTEGLPCNPVIIYFLERDISEMQALTGGQRRYFQKRLRIALAEGPKIASATSQIGGKSVQVRQIVVQPYLHDPNAERFTRYIGKRYTFELADGVPGQVALIRTEIPGPNNDFAHPVSTETLKFQAAVTKLKEQPKAPDVKPTDAPRASR